MDSFQDPIMPEPMGQTLLGPPMAGPLVNSIADPLTSALDHLEASVEQPTSILDRLSMDPLGRALDRVEASVEPILGPARMGNSPEIGGIVGEHEGFIPTPQPAASCEATVANRPPRKLSGSMPADQGAMPTWEHVNHTVTREQPLRMPRPALPELQSGINDRANSAFQRPQPAHHRMGHAAGVRRSDSQPDQYCDLREEFVSSGDCASCEDFEETDESATENGAGQCRYTYHAPVKETPRLPDTAADAGEDG
jgi:hypothetical protein